MTEIEKKLWSLLGILAQHYILSASFGQGCRGGDAILKRVTDPQVGDYVLVSAALEPIQFRIGTLVKVVEKTNEYDKVWKIKLLTGEEIEWSNVKVSSFPVGDPYCSPLLEDATKFFQPK